MNPLVSSALPGNIAMQCWLAICLPFNSGELSMVGDHKNEKTLIIDDKIKKFVELINSTKGDGELTFSHIQSRPFMPYWANIMITKFHPEVNDFQVIFHGTDVVSHVLRDQTGKFLKDPDFRSSSPEILTAHTTAFIENRPIFLKGDLSIDKRKHKKFNQVKTPLLFKNNEKGTVTYVLYY
ncbi:MAG: hypothetical protein HN578_07065 [Rhodospirillales bacterium]|nr:hypothetical protein [Rhodospirillaceae bacterium]MBT7485033.1 hypothetical protein [Rhodospirillales bacterium]MBT5033855.1 hypothetical protein [Rhodospirillaceae bacterium]MBT6219746.1 hypothetical protein [Rhodospirillaceae bacterium]MBT6363741.1 hypothetical protein [Rhodospirillaceae bacterium]